MDQKKKDIISLAISIVSFITAVVQLALVCSCEEKEEEE